MAASNGWTVRGACRQEDFEAAVRHVAVAGRHATLFSSRRADHYRIIERVN